MPTEGSPRRRAGPQHRELHSDDPDFRDVTCPDCRSADLEVISLFGGAASEVMFRCNVCRSAFNWIKWGGRLPPTVGD